MRIRNAAAVLLTGLLPFAQRARGENISLDFDGNSKAGGPAVSIQVPQPPAAAPAGKPVKRDAKLRARLRRSVHEFDEDIVAVTQQLMRFQTVAAEGKSGAAPPPTTAQPEFVRMRKYLSSVAQELGLDYAAFQNEQILEFSTGSGDETLAFYTHADVVAAGEGWLPGIDPWAGTIKDGKLYGRGAIDDKGPTASILFAMKSLKDAGLVPAGKRVAMVMTTQEELGSWDGVAAFSKEKNYRWNIVADGLYPAMIAEKGLFLAQLTYPLGPDSGGGFTHPYRVVSLKAGARPNQISDRAEAVVEAQDAAGADELNRKIADFSASHPSARLSAAAAGDRRAAVTALGTAHHASEPQGGHNATADLVEFLAGLDLEPDARGTFLRGVHEVFGAATDGSTVGLAAPEDTQFTPPGTTMVNNVLKEEDGKLSASVDVRAHPKFKLDDVQDAILQKARAVDARFEVAPEAKMDPYFNDAESPFVKQLLAVYGSETGDWRKKPLSIGGGTQTRVLTGRYRAVFGPEPDVNRIHGPNEYISLDELRQNTDIYQRAMLDILNGGN